MKRILILASWYPEPNHPTKGIFVKRQAQAIAQNHEVFLAYVRAAEKGENEKIEWENQPHFQSCTVVIRGAGLLTKIRAYHIATKELRRHINFENFDRTLVQVVHPAGIYAWIRKLFYGEAYSISEHLDLFLREDLGLDKSSFIGFWLRRLIHRQALGTTISSKALEQAFKKRGIPKLRILPNVVDLPSKKPGPWPEDQSKTFIHISSLRDHQKNIKGILDGLKLLKAQRQDWKFEFMGSGPDLEGLQEYSRSLGLSDLVSFRGYISEAEKVSALSMAIAHVMLSHYEGFSVSTAEAIAYGCPVVVSDCGGPGDFVNEANGYLIDKSPKLLAETLDRHLDHYARFDRVRMYEFIADNYSSKAIGKGYTDFLKL